MELDEDYTMGLNAIADFLAEAGTPSPEHEGNQQAGTQATSPGKDQKRGGRIIRRRARKACVECHKRKVRCDVLTRGQVCTNCRLDGLPCKLPAKDGRRKNQLIPPPGNTEVEIPAARIDLPSLIPIATAIIADDKKTSDIPSFIPIRDEAPSFCNAWSFRPSHSSSLSSTNSSSTSHIDVLFSYYGFIESESLSHVPPEDFKFLENKGCFHVSVRSVLDEFIKHYFLHVHPVLPILNETQFWNMYLGDGRCGTSTPMKISLFLFRAIMFVSCSFVSEDFLKQMGFRDAFEARLNLYRRAKLLFDFDTTSDPISIAQAALMLTYYSSDREPLANTSWLRVAIQYAQQERAHLYNQTNDLSYADRQVRKRLWWCCILRDRILPLGVRRSIQITHTTFALQSSPPLNGFDLESGSAYSKVYDHSTKQILNKVMQKQVELAIILTDVLELIYPVGQLDYNRLMKLPMQVTVVKGRLESWLRELQRTITPSEKSSHKSIHLFLGLTEIYYHSAQAALCQYESLALQARSPRHSHRNAELGTQLHASIASISKTVGELVHLDVARYLPVSAVAYMALPIILNSIDLQNTKLDESNRNRNGDWNGNENGNGNGNKGGGIQTKRQQLRLYNEAMSLCHARYSGVGLCLRYIDASIASARKEFSSLPEGMKGEKGGLIDAGAGFDDAEDPELCLSTSTSCSALADVTTKGRDRMDDWFEAFVSNPRQYLRMAFTVDIWMSVGKMARHDDLPRVLMLENQGRCESVLGLGVPRSLGDAGIEDEEEGGVDLIGDVDVDVDLIGGVVGGDDGGDGLLRELVGEGVKRREDERVGIEGQNKRRDLDYFDFGRADGRADGSVTGGGNGGDGADCNNRLPFGLEVEESVGSLSIENEHEMGSEGDGEGEGDSTSLDQGCWDNVMVDGILEDVLTISSF